MCVNTLKKVKHANIYNCKRYNLIVSFLHNFIIGHLRIYLYRDGDNSAGAQRSLIGRTSIIHYRSTYSLKMVPGKPPPSMRTVAPSVNKKKNKDISESFAPSNKTSHDSFAHRAMSTLVKSKYPVVFKRSSVSALYSRETIIFISPQDCMLSVIMENSIKRYQY